MSAKYRPAVLMIVLAGFALRLWQLGAQSLWYDETVSAYLASKSIPALIAHTAGDIHPPGYYVLLHLWTRLVGDSEYGLAFFSVIFGLLLVVAAYALARQMLGDKAAVWGALLVSISPFEIWYSQEVRMYTLAALLGLVALWSMWRIMTGWSDGVEEDRSRRRLPWALAVYVLSAALGLYVLYYFAFLLLALNGLGLLWLVRRGAWRRLLEWLAVQAAVILLYVPWLPISWRQATNPPVPPWRDFGPWGRNAVEAWSALSLGQSVQPRQVWPVLIVSAGLFGLGLLYVQRRQRQAPAGRLAPDPAVLLAVFTFGSLFIIWGLSLVVPLYHVRYLFTYATAFYLLLGAGIAWLVSNRLRAVALISVLVIGLASAFSLVELHTNPRYAADDLRGAVNFIAERWRPGDVILVNAGYAYTAFDYYFPDSYAGPVRLVDDWQPPQAGRPLVLQGGIIGGDPSLGWGDPNSDFYATTEAATANGLARVNRQFPRLWVLRIYDTVADPGGFVRRWLETHMLAFEDRTFAGPSYVHVQGFLSADQPPPPEGQMVQYDGGLTLLGWQVSEAGAVGGDIDVVLWLETSADSVARLTPIALSLKLWHADESSQPTLMAQSDEWPAGNLLPTTAWEPDRPMRYPMRLRLPDNLPDGGQFWLELQVYDPASLQPLERSDGQGNSLRLATPAIPGD